MVRPERIKEFRFTPGSLTSNAAGSGTFFSSHTINGQVRSIEFGTNNYTTTGSVLIFASGIGNTGTGTAGLIYRVAAGSVATLGSKSIAYPYVVHSDNQGAYDDTFVTLFDINGPLRVVLSGCGASKSGTELIIRYI